MILTPALIALTAVAILVIVALLKGAVVVPKKVPSSSSAWANSIARSKRASTF